MATSIISSFGAETMPLALGVKRGVKRRHFAFGATVVSKKTPKTQDLQNVLLTTQKAAAEGQPRPHLVRATLLLASGGVEDEARLAKSGTPARKRERKRTLFCCLPFFSHGRLRQPHSDLEPRISDFGIRDYGSGKERFGEPGIERAGAGAGPAPPEADVYFFGMISVELPTGRGGEGRERGELGVGEARWWSAST
ncbi:hypothetical protein NL676_039663 [Syzygium grande]|nr:hypothetical protein NL676_039663 [Syzygium grande]